MLAEQKPQRWSKAVDNMESRVFDPETILPLELIREHTKTDDILTVTDGQLELYRKAALSAAERYTGQVLTKMQVVIDPVDIPEADYRSSWFYHTARHRIAKPGAYFYGLPNGQVLDIAVVAGMRHVKLPRIIDDFGLGCCNPCKQGLQAQFQYYAGYDCEDELPAELQLGALKYIAHVIGNPGDFISTNTAGTNDTSAAVGLANGNNPALASGAIEIWRTMVEDAI